jgi:hypothetical protein
MIIIDQLNAFAGTLVAFLGIIFIPEIRKNRLRLIFAIIFGIVTAFIGYLKVTSDITNENVTTRKIDSLNTVIARFDSSNSTLQHKVDSNLVFMKRLQLMGIGKSESNQPYFFNNQTTTFKNAKDATNVQSFNQKGGQTARDITNNSKWRLRSKFTSISVAKFTTFKDLL